MNKFYMPIEFELTEVLTCKGKGNIENKILQKYPRGLLNNKEICYLNTIIQMLWNNKLLVDIIKKESEYSNILNILNELHNNHFGLLEKAYYPDKIINYLKINPDEQKDLYRFMLNFLNNNKLDVLKNIFNFEIEEINYCSNNHFNKKTKILFNLILLKEFKSWEEGVNDYFKKESFEFKCDKCNSNKLIIEKKLKMLPNLFLIFIKNRKNFKYNTDLKLKNVIYNLYCIIIYENNHYYTYVKNFNKWFLLNDDIVKEIKVPNTILGREPYIWIYEKSNINKKSINLNKNINQNFLNNQINDIFSNKNKKIENENLASIPYKNIKKKIKPQNIIADKLDLTKIEDFNKVNLNKRANFYNNANKQEHDKLIENNKDIWLLNDRKRDQYDVDYDKGKLKKIKKKKNNKKLNFDKIHKKKFKLKSKK